MQCNWWCIHRSPLGREHGLYIRGGIRRGEICGPVGQPKKSMTTVPAIQQQAGKFELSGPHNGTLTITLRGDWTARKSTDQNLVDAVDYLVCETKDPHLTLDRITFRGEALTVWDGRVLVAVAAVLRLARKLNLVTDLQSLPEGIRGLLVMSEAVPPRGERRPAPTPSSMLLLIGQSTLQITRALGESNHFLGQSLLTLWRFMWGRARFLRSDIAVFIQETGPQALPIVGIINVLLGVILGFMGAVQLQQFGAGIYVADLVALGQTREIAPMMTAIVMAGRTGAAYAAQLGTMQVNEEIDALKTFGFSPMEFLVLPRMLALALMFPLLVLYADALGIFGGYLVGVGVLDLSTTEYIQQTRQAIDLSDIALGVVKGSIFGIMVAVTGCMHGIQSGRSASAVGNAATNAVVSGIIAIIVMTAIFAVLTNLLRI